MLRSLALIAAAACGTNEAAGRAGAPADDGAEAPRSLLPPGVYRARARGTDVYGAVFPAAGLLRLERPGPRRQNATLALPDGPGGLLGDVVI